MGLTGRDIVCVSTHYWDERRFRKQEFMSRFGRANRVLFVEPSYSMARAPEPEQRGVATNRLLRARLESRDDCVHLLKPPRGLPMWTNPTIERLNYRWYGSVIRSAMRRLEFRDPILWVYRPSYVHALGAIPHSRLVLDLVDDLAAYEPEGSPRFEYVERCVTALIRRSDLLIVTAKTLEDRYGAMARRVVQVPNGFDRSVFDLDHVSGDPPAELARLRRPILGFVGTLFTFLDFELIEATANAHSDKSLVLVGPVEGSAASDVERLKRLSNVFHLGPKPAREVPAYVAAFDVCLNPFRTGRAADSVNPLKVYEYLAMGRPVASTPMEALKREDAGREVEWGNGVEGFPQAVERCLSPSIQGRTAERRNAALRYSWDNLFARLDVACEAALGA